MVLFYQSIDEFQTINKWSIKPSIIMLKHCTIQVFLFNAYMTVLMEPKGACTSLIIDQ